ncbi:uncharacterized protein Tco025E_00953 [Trypanosoma conorhini]|uniref:Uncharacterized protein n=1 Tax=Trypanosoma conorhini TaxID=83891 RepID=A0A422QA29_9TRYP|nr:uncharacterized protein Tco025E_00953 [Trypanosoma conorhini]RNF26797.1 hypothetical protein Tco025E_00953 [Trypanosoma conorhini]
MAAFCACRRVHVPPAWVSPSQLSLFPAGDCACATHTAKEMPRLPVWFGGAALASGGYYVFYHHFYTPRHTTRRRHESAVEAEKLKLQSVLQRYAVLRQMVQKLQQSSAAATNRERLYIYCELQQLREAFYTLPMRAQSASEKQSVLQDLDAVEVTHCTALNFRDGALTLRQMITCQFCFGLYVVCFCLLDPVLRRVQCEAVERARRRGLHAVSRWMLHRLRIPVTMTLEDTLPCKNDHSDGAEAAYIVFSPQHWIEVVGFWACPTNPLLTNMRVRCLSACDAVPFELHWRGRWERMQKELQDPAAAVVGEAAVRSPTVQSSFGYPLATRVGRGDGRCDGGTDPADSTTGAAALRLLPVASAGMPRVLFVGDAVARSDVRARPTLHEVYTNVQQRQFVVKHDVAKGSKTQSDAGGRDAALAQLRAWRQRGGVPVWHSVEWGSVYGDVGPAGNRDRRELVFRVGRLCSARELVMRQVELQQRLLQQAGGDAEEVCLL